MTPHGRIRILALSTTLCAAALPAQDWTRFGWDVGRSSAPAGPSGLSAADLPGLQHQAVTIDGTVDAAAMYLHGVTVNGTTRDVFFVTTTYGRTLAIDADSGTVLWRYTPPGYDRWAGSYRITTATPAADAGRRFIYAASPDGYIQKLAIADGHPVWRTAITRLPRREKIAAPLNVVSPSGRVIATTGGYIGDAPPYQGHVAILDPAAGALLRVWNSLCSERHRLLDPAACSESGSAIWGRAGAVVDSATGDLFIATGDGRWNGRTFWGDAVIELDPDAARIVANYTPINTARLDEGDVDLGSTAPVLLGGGLVVQGGKDGRLRLLDWHRYGGAEPHQGGERQIVSTPSGDDLFTAPAVWRSGPASWLFVADNGATQAWVLDADTLRAVWRNDHPGTSPVVANGMVFVYDPSGALRIYDAPTGRELAALRCGTGHWNSPIVADGRIALPEGSANSHRESGVLNIWRTERR
jgi:outer membrane protein assembly factor BamB